MQNYFIFLILCVSLTVTKASYGPCQKINAPLPIKMLSNRCLGRSMPCLVPNGSILETNVTFVANFPAEKLRWHVLAYIGDKLVPMDRIAPPEYKYACNWLLDGKCPIEQGKIYTHSTSLEVNIEEDNVILNVEVYITGDGEPLFCYYDKITIANIQNFNIEYTKD